MKLRWIHAVIGASLICLSSSPVLASEILTPPGWRSGTWHLQNVVLSDGSTLTGDFFVTDPSNGTSVLICCNGFRDDAIGLFAGFTWDGLPPGFRVLPGVTPNGLSFKSFTNFPIDFGDGQGTIDNHRFYTIGFNFDISSPDAPILNIDITSSALIKHSIINGVQTDTVYDVVSGSATVLPIPGALPLFVTGLGMLGLLGWHRKRKVAVI